MVNDAAKEGMDPEQLRWLEAELQKSQAARPGWFFSTSPSTTPGVAIIATACARRRPLSLLALFKKYKVTHVFAAHIHSYYTGAWEGVPYTITGGAGAKLYGDDPERTISIIT